MSKLCVILQVFNDNLVWYFWALLGHSFDESVYWVGQRNSLKIVIVPLKSGLLATMIYGVIDDHYQKRACFSKLKLFFFSHVVLD